MTFLKKLGASSKDIFWKSLKKIHHNGWKVQKILGIMKKDGCEKKWYPKLSQKKGYGLQIKKFGLGKISNIFFTKWIKYSEKN